MMRYFNAIECDSYHRISPTATCPTNDNKQVLSLHISYLVLDNDNKFFFLLLQLPFVSQFSVTVYSIYIRERWPYTRKNKAEKPIYVAIKTRLGSFSDTRSLNKFDVFFSTFVCYYFICNSLWSSWTLKSNCWGPIDCCT